MISYRNLAHDFQKRAGLTFETSLSTISVILKALAHHLTRQEIATFKIGLAPELKQLVMESRARRERFQEAYLLGRGIVEMVATSLELAPAEAKRRATILLHQLREGSTPWDDPAYLEVLDYLSTAIDRTPLPAAVA